MLALTTIIPASSSAPREEEQTLTACSLSNYKATSSHGRSNRRHRRSRRKVLQQRDRAALADGVSYPRQSAAGAVDGSAGDHASQAAVVPVAQVDRDHRVPAHMLASRLALAQSGACSSGDARVAAARRGVVARAALHFVTYDPDLGLALQLVDRRAGGLSGPRSS